jgi:hypothetical protein
VSGWLYDRCKAATRQRHCHRNRTTIGRFIAVLARDRELDGKPSSGLRQQNHISKFSGSSYEQSEAYIT